MTTFSALGLLAGLAMIITIIVMFVRALKREGAAEERAKQAEADAALARRQGAIMAEDRSPSDAANRLDSGTF